MTFRLLFIGLIALFYASPSWAEGRCPDGYFPIGGGGAGWEGCAPMGGGDGDEDYGGGAQFYSPEEWQAFSDHTAKEAAENERELLLMRQRYQQLQQGLWFMPGEIPFAGWFSGSASDALNQNRGIQQDVGCTISYWTLNGAVTMSALDGPDEMAVISYTSYDIPAPNKPLFKKIALTQSGQTQTVNAMISSAGRRKRKMGIVSFAVPSGAILVNAIEDVQDYSLADQGKTIFSGQWHDGLRARDALAQCIARQQ